MFKNIKDEPKFNTASYTTQVLGAQGGKNRTPEDVRVFLGCKHVYHYGCLRDVCVTGGNNNCPNPDCLEEFTGNYIKEMTDRYQLVTRQVKNRKFLLHSGYIKIKMVNMDPKLYDRCLHRPPLSKTELVNINNLADQNKILKHKLVEEKLGETREEEVQTNSETSENEDIQSRVINLQIEVSVRRTT